MTSRERRSLRRELKRQGLSEEEIQIIINNTVAETRDEARNELTSGLTRKERRHVEKRHKRKNK
ncbi:hypothetical protein [Photobacterium lutimaris]|uniref:hypothetical protein n=1 Tax=Photobacterium lutimaris TaxID=388278 RepID=UPI00105BAC9A|nr:hypothetical protein [Photobacterium lutimaris]TDR74919.1 hypothetical protein DFP78_106250 [Photobacterium lutimaris]